VPRESPETLSVPQGFGSRREKTMEVKSHANVPGVDPKGLLKKRSEEKRDSGKVVVTLWN